MTEVAASPRRGRPSTGARERILDAALEVLKREGYAGLSISKVAAQAGENKALIAYHFGSKQGLVAETGLAVGEMITAEVLAGVDGARTVAGVIEGSVDGVWNILDRDERLARVYFDLNAVSVVEEEVRGVMREIKAGWRRVLTTLLSDAEDGSPARAIGPAATFVIAGIEGLCLERIERGDTADLRGARRLFVASAADAIAGLR